MARALAVRLAAPAALLALLLAAAPARALLPVPPLTGPIVDRTGKLGQGDVARLDALARQARAENGGAGVQLQYLVVGSLEGEAIADYSMRVAEAWKIGSRQAGNGVLVTVALDDRQVRIEVGNGLEGELTDAQAGRIIREGMAPAFRDGRYGDGLYQAGVQILGTLGALPAGLTVARRPARGLHPSGLGILALVVLFVVLRILTGFGFRRRRTLWGLPWVVGGSSWRGGGWGSGGGSWGGGGGGWSGGGGGFSGGGASGRW